MGVLLCLRLSAIQGMRTRREPVIAHLDSGRTLLYHKHLSPVSTVHWTQAASASRDYEVPGYTFGGSLFLTFQPPGEHLALPLPRSEEGHHGISLPDPADADEV
jgi:hypothetical protein